MLLTVILIIISFPSPTHAFIPGLKPSFSANPWHRNLSFSSPGLTTWIPQTFTVTSEHIRFYFLVSLFYAIFFLLSFPCSRLSWLMSAFERTLKRHLVSYRMDRVLDARTTYSSAAALAACWSAFNSRAVGAAACRAEAICVCAGTHCSRRICNDPWLELLALVEIAEWERDFNVNARSRRTNWPEQVDPVNDAFIGRAPRQRHDRTSRTDWLRRNSDGQFSVGSLQFANSSSISVRLSSRAANDTWSAVGLPTASRPRRCPLSRLADHSLIWRRLPLSSSFVVVVVVVQLSLFASGNHRRHRKWRHESPQPRFRLLRTDTADRLAESNRQ